MDLSPEDAKHVQQLIKDVADTYIARSLDHHDAEQVQRHIRVTVGPILTSLGGSPWTSPLLVAWLWVEQPDPDGPLRDVQPTSATGETVEEALEGIRQQFGISDWNDLDRYRQRQ